MEDWGHVSKCAQIRLVHTTAAVYLVIHCLPMVLVAMVRDISEGNTIYDIVRAFHYV